MTVHASQLTDSQRFTEIRLDSQLFCKPNVMIILLHSSPNSQHRNVCSQRIMVIPCESLNSNV